MFKLSDDNKEVLRALMNQSGTATIAYALADLCRERMASLPDGTAVKAYWEKKALGLERYADEMLDGW